MYQPKIDMKTMRFVGAEALAHWKHPRFGLLPQSAVAPLVERSEDHSRLLIEFSIDESIACMGRWLKRGSELRVAINLAARAFDRLDLPERLLALASEHQVASEMLTIEVAQTQVARDAMRMLDVAARLRLKRFKLSIDDFGGGDSWLEQLQQLPFSEMKIGREFVEGCVTSPAKRSVVDACLALARSMKLLSVAEGVPRKDEWDLLESLGCDVAQGSFIARPMSEEGLEQWAAQWALRGER
jgi:EAL domain-containing protein (putative c-di-GMP-specific phosphodiesterase class I)